MEGRKMALTIFKIWLVMLAIVDFMVITQLIARIVLFIAGKTRSVDWTGYNRVMLGLLAVTFLPITAMVIYLRQ